MPVHLGGRAMTALYEIEMQHSEDSFKAMAHMQYDLFCQKNRVARTVISLLCMVAGILYFSAWWGILLVAYGCYLSTSTYASANRTAHKLAEQLKNGGCPFPASSYAFKENEMEIYCLPEHTLDGFLAYSEIRRMGEDGRYFYIFGNEYGGYMIPKEGLGKSVAGFKDFLEEVTGKNIRSSRVPAVRLIAWIKRKRRSF